MQAHARGRRRRSAVALAALVVVLIGGVVLATAGSGVIDAAGRYLPWSSPESSCETTEVTVVAAPQISRVVQAVVGPLNGRPLSNGSCLRVVVQSEAPATTVENAAMTAASQLPQVWIPDSSIWPGQTDAWPAQVVGSMATSPVVLAMSPASQHALRWQDGKVAWPQALDGSHELITPSMTDDASSLLALLALAQSLGPGTQTEQRVAATVLAASRITLPDLPSAVELAGSAGAKGPGILVTSQQTVTDADHDQPGRLVAVHPAGQPTALDFPILRVSRPSDDPVLTAGADIVLRALTGAQGRQAAAAAGFGPPSTSAVPQSDADKQAMAQVARKSAQFVALVRTLALPSRLLVLVDTSLSMNQQVRPGMTRAVLAATAAIGAGRLLPDRSAIGLWSFAGRQPGGAPYQQLAKIDQLSNVDGVRPDGKDITHRDIVEGLLAGLPRHLGSGGTSLYDTALAALRNARANYDPQANNAVVLFTDGANDYPGGISLARFEREARADAAAHRRQPVQLIAIGIGPQADMASLRAMSAAAGGRAYQANTVATLRTVLFDAVAHRHVQPTSS